MSDNTSESAATTPAGGEAAPARRRRATRSVAAPDAVSTPAAPAVAAPEPAAEAAPTKRPARKRSRPAVEAASDVVVETAAAPAAQPATEPAATAPRAGRARAGRKAGAPAAAEAPSTEAPSTESPSTEAPSTEAPSTEAPSTDAAPAAPEAKAPAKTRKRATRPAAAAAETAPTVDAPAEAIAVEAPAAPEAVAEQAPAAPARRRRASSRPAAAPGAPVEQAAQVAEAVAPADTEEPTEEPTEDEQAAPALDVLAAFAGTPTTAAEPTRRSTRAPKKAAATPAVAQPDAAPAAGQSAQSPRLATTALLFQAPDPTATRQRRRRATAGAGSPEAISEATREHEPQVAADQEAAAVESLVEAEQAEAQPATSGNRNSRRRGRRGRGGEPPRASVQDEVDEDEDSPVVGEDETVDVEAVEGDVEDDETDADENESDENEADDSDDEGNGAAGAPRRRRRRGGRGRRRPESGDAGSDDADVTTEGDADSSDAEGDQDDDESDDVETEGGEPRSSSRRRRRRRGSARSGDSEGGGEPRPARTRPVSDEVTALRGSTRLEAKRQRRREGRDAGRRRQIITEAEFLARRESVDRSMIVREKAGRTQIAVLEDGVLVEHYVSNQAQVSMVGNVYLGRVQNVLPSMEAAFVDVGKGRNAVLYAGEVNWDAANVEGGSARRIEQALKSGDSVLVQVTKDPIGHKGARLTSQVTLAGRYLVYVPGGGMTGISRKLPDIERNRLKKILREVVPDSAGVIVRTAAEGASEEELRADIARLQSQWEAIEKKSKSASAPALLQGEPDMAIRVVRDIFNDDFGSLIVQGDEAWSTISSYIDELAPDLAQKISKYAGSSSHSADVFADHRIDEQLAKGMDRKVWLPSGGSLVIDRTEAMTVVDVNTGKFTGSGGTLEETVTRNNLEAAEEIVRQLRLRDIGGMIVVDFIDMVLESNRDLVLRRLVECLGRDRTKHQVAEVTSLGLVQMTRKRVGQGLVEAFSETCEHCHGRGFIVHDEPIEKNVRPDAGAAQPVSDSAAPAGEAKRARRKRGGAAKDPVGTAAHSAVPVLPEAREAVKATLATIAAAAAHAHDHDHDHDHDAAPVAVEPDVAVELDGVAVLDDAIEEVVVESDASTDEPVEEVAEDGQAPAEPQRAVLDVLAAFPDFEPGTTTDTTLALTPVAPDLFEGDDEEPEGR